MRKLEGLLLALCVSLSAAAGPPAPPAEKGAKTPADNPEEALRYFLQKRSPDGVSPISAEWYLKALDQMRDMPQHSISLDEPLPSRREMTTAGIEPTVLNGWTYLGPGNIGGRTRALVIDPANPATMWAAGVAGGVWKTTNSGASWTALSDFAPNLAVTALALDPSNPNILYAGTGEGFFNIDAVRGAGVLKSTDGGTTWAQLASTRSSSFYYVNKIVVSPLTGRLYVATRSGIFLSADGGGSFLNVYPTGLTGGVTDLVIRTDQSTDYMLATAGIFGQALILLNVDAANTFAWNTAYTESSMGRTSLAIAPSNQNVIYALSDSVVPASNYTSGLNAVFRSTDGGSTWVATVRNTDPKKLNTLLLSNPIAANYSTCYPGLSDTYINQGWYDNVIAVDPVDSNKVWVGGIDLFRSDDGGANWGLASYWWFPPTTNTPYAHADQHAIVFHPQYNGSTNQTMYVGNDGGLFRTDNASAATSTDVCGNAPGAITWKNLNNGYGVTQFYAGTAFPDGATYFGGTQDNGTNLGKDSTGVNGWKSILGGDGGYVAYDPTNTNVLYAENYLLSIQKSTDGGTTWKSATSGIGSDSFNFINPFVMDPTNPQRLWTGGRTMWTTTNGGTSWSAGSTALVGSSGSPVSALAVAKTDGNYVLAGRGDGYIHSTTSGLTSGSGTTWSQVQPTGSSAWVSGLAFDPANKNIAYATFSTFGVPHVWKSTDAGLTWISISGSGATGIPDVPAESVLVDPNNSSRLYVGTDMGIFSSTDGGSTWAVENTGFPNVITDGLTVSNNNLFAFTHGRGAWRVALAAGTCTYSLNPTSVSWPAAGASGVVSVTAGAGCAWTATSNASWITASGSGTGNGSFSVQAAANTGATRVGTVSVANQTFTVSQAGTAGGTCTPDSTTLCIGNRFQVRVSWSTSQGGGQSGQGNAVSTANIGFSSGGIFWFFDSTNPEMLVKVLDGCAVNGKYWVFASAGTNVGLNVTLTDTSNGTVKTYTNPDLTPAQPIQDINAFATCP